MPFTLFHSRFPEIAERETRTVTVLDDDSRSPLPEGDYSFLEMFCDEAGCDCRRVFFYVVTSLSRDVEAVVAWGWENVDFYAKWMRDDDPEVVAELKGPVLNVGSPVSPRAPAILRVVKDILLRDDAYTDRVKAHYKLFRSTVERIPNRRGRSGRAKK